MLTGKPNGGWRYGEFENQILGIGYFRFNNKLCLLKIQFSKIQKIVPLT